MTFTIHPPAAASRLRITASVGFVALAEAPHLYVIIKNKRGWDIPGGHVEPGETPAQAFTREVREESGCELISEPVPVAVLQSLQRPGTGIMVYRGICRRGEFAPGDETADTVFVGLAELQRAYFGDKQLMQELVRLL